MSEPVRSVLPAKCEPSYNAKEELTRSKAGLMLEYPFLGFLLMSCEFHWSEDVPTLCATTINDRNQIFIGEDCFMNTLATDSERCFAIAHELCHIFFNHIDQCFTHNYNPQLWNIATDYFINGHLEDMKSNYLVLPDWVLLRQDMKGKDSHTIYHELLEENNNDVNKAIENNGGQVFEDTLDKGQHPGKSRGNGHNGVPLDLVSVHKESEQTKTDNAQTVTAAAEQSAEKEMGSGAGGLLRELYDFVTPKIHWSEELRDFVVETCKEDYTYSRPSRRSQGNVVFPSMDGDKIRVLFGIDTSGSMSSKELSDALTELKGVIDSYEGWEVTLISCDTSAHVIGHYSSEDGDDFTDVDKGLVGGGGTELSSMIEYGNEEMEEQPNVTIIVTDGYIPAEPYENAISDDVPVLTVITEEGNTELQNELEQTKVIQMN